VVLRNANPDRTALVAQIRSALERYTFKVEIEAAAAQ